MKFTEVINTNRFIDQRAESEKHRLHNRIHNFHVIPEGMESEGRTLHDTPTPQERLVKSGDESVKPVSPCNCRMTCRKMHHSFCMKDAALGSVAAKLEWLNNMNGY
jgi:hypothetical protein